MFAVRLATQRLVCLALCHKFANVRAGLCLVLACAVQLAVLTWHALRTPGDEGVTRQAQCGGFHRVGGGKRCAAVGGQVVVVFAGGFCQRCASTAGVTSALSLRPASPPTPLPSLYWRQLGIFLKTLNQGSLTDQSPSSCTLH